MEDPAKYLPLTHKNLNLFIKQGRLIDNIRIYRDRLSGIYELNEESNLRFDNVEKAIYLSEGLKTCLSMLYELLEKLPAEKVKLYLDFLERAYIRGYYLKNLISFCANCDSLINYIEKELQIERGLNLPYHDIIPGVPSFKDILKSLRKISSEEEFQKFEDLLARKKIFGRKIEIYYFILDFTSVSEMKRYLNDEINLREKIYGIV